MTASRVSRSWTDMGAATGLSGRYSHRGVSFADLSHGWIVGNFGTILRTTTGGASWFLQGRELGAFGITFNDVQVRGDSLSIIIYRQEVERGSYALTAEQF